MKIEIISKEDYTILLDLYTRFPALTLQNKGYEGLDKSAFTPEEKEAFEAVTNLLKNHIAGFSSFQNFRHNKAGKVELRLQYNYNYDGGLPFTGVGYILLDELLNGFNK